MGGGFSLDCAPLKDNCLALRNKTQNIGKTPMNRDVDSSSSESDDEPLYDGGYNTPNLNHLNTLTHTTLTTTTDDDVPLPVSRTASYDADDFSKELYKEFKESIISRDFENAMAIIDEYNNIDFYNIYFTNGDSCIHYAIHYNNKKFLYYLLVNGMDPNIQNKYTHDTPLHSAIIQENIKMIVLLIKYKADINIKNITGKTPFDIAHNCKNKDILNLFDKDVQSMVQNGVDDIATLEVQKSFEIKITKFGKGYENNENINLNSNNSSTNNKRIEQGYDTEASQLSDMSLPGGTTLSAKTSGVIPDIGSEITSTDIGNDQTMIIHDETMFIVNDDDDDIDGDDDLKIEGNNSASKKDIKYRKMSRSVGIAMKTVSNFKKSRLDEAVLSDWLQRLRTNIYPKIYVKKYVFVHDGHLIWNSKEITLDSNEVVNDKLRKKVDGCISLLMVTDIIQYKSKKQNNFKFQIKCVNPKISRKKRKNKKDKVFLFKCENKEQRDKWVNNLKICCDNLSNIMNENDE